MVDKAGRLGDAREVPAVSISNNVTLTCEVCMEDPCKEAWLVEQ